jgi:hypothetical protein
VHDALRLLALVALLSCLDSCARRQSLPTVAASPVRSQPTAPRFDEYPAERALAGPPRAPVLSTRHARLYRTVLRDAAAEGPNFDGHYRVAIWGCGTSCVRWAIIDLETGRVSFPDVEPGSCSGRKDWETSTPVPEWFEQRIDSSLLVINDCRGPTAPVGDHVFDTRRSFVWRDHALHHLRDEPLDYWSRPTQSP